MGADQIAEIRPIIKELEADELERGGERTAQFFARFKLASSDTPWVELYLQDEVIVNFWFQSASDPLDYLNRAGVDLPPGTRVVEWASGYCTLACARASTAELARLVDDLFLKMFACGEDYSLDTEVCRLS